MRRLPAALVACALAAAPVALTAQTPPSQTTAVRTIPPVTRPGHAHPQPGASGSAAYRNHNRKGNPYAGSYPVVIDGNAMNRLLATPTPKPKHSPAAKAPYGEQTFETHSTNDAR